MTAIPNSSRSLPLFQQAMQKMPGGIWIGLANGWQRAMKGFWRAFRARMRIERTGHAFTLTHPKNWPIEITTQPVPTFAAPDFSRFQARFGTRGSEAAAILEYGGTVRPERGGWVAMPIGAALTRSGKVRPSWSTPEKARRRYGVRFLSQKTRSPNVLLLYPLVKRKRGRGRPSKNPRKNANPGRLVRGPLPAFMLTRQHVHRGGWLRLDESWRASSAENVARVEKEMAIAIAEILKGRVPKLTARRSFAS